MFKRFWDWLQDELENIYWEFQDQLETERYRESGYFYLLLKELERKRGYNVFGVD